MPGRGPLARGLACQWGVRRRRCRSRLRVAAGRGTRRSGPPARARAGHCCITVLPPVPPGVTVQVQSWLQAIIRPSHGHGDVTV